jgi:hypothetical protein
MKGARVSGIRHGAIAIALGCAVAGAIATPAEGRPSPGPGLESSRQTLLDRIDERLADLTKLDATISATTNLPQEHRQQLTTIVSTARSGLSTLRSTAAAETTPAGLAAAGAKMTTGYRVYLLAVPQVRLTIAADLEADVGQRLETVADRLATAIEKAKAAGMDSAAAEADLADLRAQLAAAKAAVEGQANTLLAIRPGPSEDVITTKINIAREAVRNGRADLKAASADAKKIRAALEPHRPGPVRSKSAKPTRS